MVNIPSDKITNQKKRFEYMGAGVIIPVLIWPIQMGNAKAWNQYCGIILYVLEHLVPLA